MQVTVFKAYFPLPLGNDYCERSDWVENYMSLTVSDTYFD